MNNNGRKRGGRGGKRQIIADYIDYSTPQRMQVSAIDCYSTSHVTGTASPLAGDQCGAFTYGRGNGEASASPTVMMVFNRASLTLTDTDMHARVTQSHGRASRHLLPRLISTCPAKHRHG